MKQATVLVVLAVGMALSMAQLTATPALAQKCTDGKGNEIECPPKDGNNGSGRGEEKKAATLTLPPPTATLTFTPKPTATLTPKPTATLTPVAAAVVPPPPPGPPESAAFCWTWPAMLALGALGLLAALVFRPADSGQGRVGLSHVTGVRLDPGRGMDAPHRLSVDDVRLDRGDDVGGPPSTPQSAAASPQVALSIMGAHGVLVRGLLLSTFAFGLEGLGGLALGLPCESAPLALVSAGAIGSLLAILWNAPMLPRFGPGRAGPTQTDGGMQLPSEGPTGVDLSRMSIEDAVMMLFMLISQDSRNDMRDQLGEMEAARRRANKGSGIDAAGTSMPELPEGSDMNVDRDTHTGMFLESGEPTRASDSSHFFREFKQPSLPRKRPTKRPSPPGGDSGDTGHGDTSDS